ncbi:MAG: hypothetical protein HKP61_09615 [Dactylosporangium sp.]|nr:hypothetical protein [Dactylosporangium sp.]NNJ61189.1 hypothetical protein [Dactylosporangium sp.]
MTEALPLVLLPAAVFVVTTRAVRPATGVLAPRRLTLVRASVLTGALAVCSVEALSTFRLINFAGVAAVWFAALLIAGVGAWWRSRAARPDGPDPPAGADQPSGLRRGWARARRRWSSFGPPYRGLLLLLGGLLAAEFLLALICAPNTYDSQTYHLPRIEHWITQHSVEPYASNIHRQVTYPPGAEYLLLHLRLLTGSVVFYASVQWLCGLLCLVATTRITAQLGGGRGAQVLTAVVVGTTPAVVLEASSTQVDLVMAAWVAVLATLVLDGLGRRPATVPGPGSVLLLGLATGLIAITKSTGLPLAGALLAWWFLAWLRRSTRAPDGVRTGRRVVTVARIVGGAVAVFGLISAVTGPYLWRIHTEFGHPLGPPYLRESIALQRHDPAAVLVNGLRQAHTLLDTPLPGVSEATAEGVIWISEALGVDPQDPRITFDNTTFPAVAWYPSEGKAALPVQAVLLGAGVLTLLARPGLRCSGARRGLAIIILLGCVTHTATVTWSPWANRLTMHLIVLAGPLAGLWLARLAPQTRGDGSRRARRPARRLIAAGTVGTLVAAATIGWLSALHGWPRRLVGHQSALVLDRWHSTFVTRPTWADDYAEVGSAVRAAGARRIGIVQGNDSWEYPWWLVFEGRELVALQSQMPRHPPAAADSVDAIVCSASTDVCRRYPPEGWVVVQQNTLTYALPPER